MAHFPAPWGIHSQDGAHPQVTAALARGLVYTVTGGHHGVAGPEDLRVEPMPTPGAGVRVMPGAATVRRGNSRESYFVHTPSAVTVPVPNGGATGDTKLVALTISDPNFGGSWPADPEAYEYASIQVFGGVDAGNVDAFLDALTVPALPLAVIAVPANTATITAGMITNQRALVSGATHLSFWQAPGGTRDLAQGAWVTLAAVETRPPAWATRALVDGKMLGLIGSNSVQGASRVRISSVSTGAEAACAPVAVTRSQAGNHRVDMFPCGVVENLAPIIRAGRVRIEMQFSADGHNTSPKLTVDHGTAFPLRVDWVQAAA